MEMDMDRRGWMLDVMDVLDVLDVLYVPIHGRERQRRHVKNLSWHPDQGFILDDSFRRQGKCRGVMR